MLKIKQNEKEVEREIGRKREELELVKRMDEVIDVKWLKSFNRDSEMLWPNQNHPIKRSFELICNCIITKSSLIESL